MASDATILIVDDDEATRQLLQHHLRASHTVLTAADTAQALDVLSRSEVDVVVTDTDVSDVRNHELWTALRDHAADVPVVLVTDTRGLPVAVGALKAGTRHFVAKPPQAGELAGAIHDAIAERRLAQRVLRHRATTRRSTGIVAESSSMQKVISRIDRAAQCDTPVLLIGESGTGKELLARALHTNGPRAHGPFVAVNCSAIPETLLESELFGHRRGAFTDAREDQRGSFQAAHRGTLFLDEIGDMPPSLQGKLLRALQSKEVQPLGGTVPVSVDARIVAATHRDLDELVAMGGFRQDLLYRINVIEVRVPPLRERPDDLEPLVARFLETLGARLNRPVTMVAADAMAALVHHTWPGNVRELENAIERALVLGGGPVIRVDDLPEALRVRTSSAVGRRALGRSLAEVERDHILGTLRASAGNKTAAARALGLDRKTLYRKLGRHKIEAR